MLDNFNFSEYAERIRLSVTASLNITFKIKAILFSVSE